MISYNYYISVNWISIVALLKFAIWYWNTYLNKCGYVIYHLNAHFSLDVLFANNLVLAVYFIFILNYGKDGQKANLSDFLTGVQNGL